MPQQPTNKQGKKVKFIRSKGRVIPIRADKFKGGKAGGKGKKKGGISKSTRKTLQKVAIRKEMKKSGLGFKKRSAGTRFKQGAVLGGIIGGIAASPALLTKGTRGLGAAVVGTAALAVGGLEAAFGKRKQVTIKNRKKFQKFLKDRKERKGDTGF